MARFDVPVDFTVTLRGCDCIEVEAGTYGEARRRAARQLRAKLDGLALAFPAGATVELEIDNSFACESAPLENRKP